MYPQMGDIEINVFRSVIYCTVGFIKYLTETNPLLKFTTELGDPSTTKKKGTIKICAIKLKVHRFFFIEKNQNKTSLKRVSDPFFHDQKSLHFFDLFFYTGIFRTRFNFYHFSYKYFLKLWKAVVHVDWLFNQTSSHLEPPFAFTAVNTFILPYTVSET